jgi:hypothetical protein
MFHRSSEYPEFSERQELSLTSTHPIRILPTGVSGCESNLSVFYELQRAAVKQNISKIKENCQRVFFKLGISPNLEKNRLICFSKIGESCNQNFPKQGEREGDPLFPSPLLGRAVPAYGYRSYHKFSSITIKCQRR